MVRYKLPIHFTLTGLSQQMNLPTALSIFNFHCSKFLPFHEGSPNLAGRPKIIILQSGLGIAEERHEPKIHVQLLMAVKKR